MSNIIIKIKPIISNIELNTLFESAWTDFEITDFTSILKYSLTYVCAFSGSRLIGFVNIAWDGGIHGFILDTTVHPEFRRQGIGTEMMKQAAITAKKLGIEWLHVDYEPHLDTFYKGCGFKETFTGILNLKEK